jgi:hypothetical protein
MFDLHEARLIQDVVKNSAPNALSLYIGPVPQGKYWTILSASYNPDVAETKVVHFQVLSRGSSVTAVTAPAAVALSGTLMLPLVYAGDEIVLFPGEYLYAQRDSATAGSAMQLRSRVVESDLPYYSYTDPQKKVMQATMKHGSVFRATGALSQTGGLGGSGDAGMGFGGGGGGPTEPGA